MNVCRCGRVHPADAVVAVHRFTGTTSYRAQLPDAALRATRELAMADVCPHWPPTWPQALHAYDAHLADDGRIVRRGKTLGVRVYEKKNRLRIESETGALLASGPVRPETVERFVESFWYWSKQ